MEQVIIDIIDKKAAKQYNKLTPTKRKAYRGMLYAGAQITMNGYTVRDVAAEIGYSESGTSKLAQKWIELMRQGDVTVNLIIAAIHKLPKSKRFKQGKHDTPTIKLTPTIVPESHKEETPRPMPAQTPTPNENKRKGKYVLGFFITPEDEMRERAAIRSSILFFQTYGKGAKPRMNGEYYTPGTHQMKDSEDSKKWLPLETAAMYCGCKAELISKAGQNGVIERRVYKRNASRNYYEYNIADLDKFIRDNHLL